MEMVSHDYETLDVCNKERETINTEETQKQLAGAYDVTTCEAYGTAKTSISTPTDGYEVTQCPAYVTTASTEQRETSLQVRDLTYCDVMCKFPATHFHACDMRTIIPLIARCGVF